MNVVRGVVENGVVKPSVPVALRDGTEVLVVFNAASESSAQVPSVPASWLVEIGGKVSVGGDAVADTERYDE
ncbi:MAG: antitoxin family protein [Myxococcota bacterium]|nr:antitoxin family protein [Myxococcota bacterium]